MKWIQIFDFIRHLLELFFYLVTGPLVTAVAFKKISQRKSMRKQILELENKIQMLEQGNAKYIESKEVTNADK